MRPLRPALLAVVLQLFALMPTAFAAPVETLDWAQCLAEAAGRHPDLRSAAESVRQFEAQRRIVKGGMLPSVSASAGGERSGSSAASATGAWSYGVTASQLLFDGAKTSSEVKSATETVKASRYSEESVSVDTRYALRTAFVQLLTAQKQVSLAQEIMTKRKQNLRLIALLYKSGTEHIGSLSKAQADLAEAEFEVAQARRGLELAQVMLGTQLGRASSGPLRVTGRFTASQQTRQSPDFDRIAKESPTYLNLTAQKDAAGYSLQAARSAFMPSVYLSTGFGNSAFRQLPPDRTDWQAGIDVSVPIYAGGSGKAGVAKARALVNQLGADEESLYLSLKRSLAQAWKSFVDASENVDVQKKFLAAASERARIADAQYSAGLVSFNEWTIIEDNLVTAKKSYLNAQSNLLTAEAAWVQAKGGTLESR
ncbi:transporter [Chlorobaculum limnaeum]|uniref:Transporter n=1 Tax=Chlorobaculum limnaeum TaxID=274537 RepID=A0A1D8D547_CHLLM|nr:TolC family protein [Chlorobaculum limnaeum]AOS84397.1 transporter [Chlorobaculum limnaeum]